MNSKKRYCLIIISLLMINFISFSEMTSYGSLKNNTGADFMIQFPNGYPFFSTYTDNKTGDVNLYTVDTNFDSLLLNNYSFMNDQLQSSSTVSLRISQLLGNYGYVQYANYFISNNSKFVILRTYLDPFNTFTILSLDTNKSISFHSDTTAYYLSLISRFSNSPDVYFSLNNETYLLIIKFSFINNNFSIFYQKSFSNINIPVTSIYHDNKIFILLSSPSGNSEILSLNEQGLVFSKVLFLSSIESFTIFDNGFLFLTYNGYLYSYFYNGAYTQINSFNNLKLLIPYDNNSFLAISFSYLSIFKINDTGQSINLQQEYNYTINYSYNLYLLYYFQALTIKNNQYYAYQSENGPFSQNYLVINHVYHTPTNYNIPITTSTTNYDSNSQNQLSFNTISSVSIQSMDLINSALLFILVAIFILGGTFFFASKRNSTNNYDYIKNINRTNKTELIPDIHSYSEIKKELNCLNCGYTYQFGDVFCQNCGNKLF